MKPNVAVLLPILVIVSLGIGLSAGSVPLSPGEVWGGLWGDSSTSTIVRDLRVPRVLLAFLVGGSLDRKSVV